MAVHQIDPASDEYRRFVLLYEAARRTRPSQIDRWNGKLYATADEGSNWGSFQVDGSLKLSRELVLDRLGPDTAPHDQVQALTTILHEAYHARVDINAQDEPNAVLSQHSKALDEGLTEWVAVDDTPAFTALAGYDDLPDPTPEYPHAHHAATALLEYAAGPEGARDLATKALDRPVVMRWDAIADEIVRNRLSDVVPADFEHQQAARAELINSMAHPGWAELHKSAQDRAGQVAAADSQAGLGAAAQRIRGHYAQSGGAPYPAATPNFLIAKQAERSLDGAQQRVASRSDAAAAGARFLSGSAPAAGAVRRRPELGSGARGAGAPSGGRGGVWLPMQPTDRGRG